MWHQIRLYKNVSVCISAVRLEVCRPPMRATAYWLFIDILVCCGHTAIRHLVISLKSILLYRQRPLHLHIVTDTVRGQKILSHLLNTWNITSLNFSIYLSTDAASDVAWIKTSHHSALSGLLKLTVPSILPQDLKKVILLDTDLIFLSDIGILWDVFDRFNSKQCLGIAENLSDWYLRKNTSGTTIRWPAKGRGFNTGIVLMHLEKLRVLSWTSLYTRVAEENLKFFNFTHLADQVSTLNIVSFSLTLCYYELLYLIVTKITFTLFHFVLSFSLIIDFKNDIDVSLVTQLSYERLAVLEKLLSSWQGPASVTLYLSDSEAYQFVQLLGQSISLNRRNIAYHIVFREGVGTAHNVFQYVSFELLNCRRETWAAGHLATDYDRWRNATSPYRVVYWSMDFEPYIAVRSDVVRYDTRFLGYGWNKVSHIMELDSIGYEFIVLPNVFIVHFPHLLSPEASRFRTSFFYRQCVKLLKGQFMKDLAKRYAHNRSRVVKIRAHSFD
ncbi:unnamed protein product [Soboliphyme baturini]|uniref:Glycosyltransferase-like protein LARGE1 n=1 Tax=Soboliphyme baturini TaxID=241478 RepID=A0A183IAX6_9BILA|nr:unnamed protein product [Soboliphyme baturini]